MSDIIDRANDLADFDRERAIANALAKKPVANAVFAESGAQLCAECDEPIPVQRLSVIPDAVLCIECQEVWEKHL